VAKPGESRFYPRPRWQLALNPDDVRYFPEAPVKHQEPPNAGFGHDLIVAAASMTGQNAPRIPCMARVGPIKFDAIDDQPIRRRAIRSALEAPTRTNLFFTPN
jgi:hypothetical protein